MEQEYKYMVVTSCMTYNHAPYIVDAMNGFAMQETTFPVYYLITGLISYFLNSYFSGKFLGYSSWMQLKDIAPSYGLATLIAVSVFFLKYLSITNWVILPLQIALGVSIFFLFCTKTKMPEYQEVLDMLKPYLNKIKK